MAIKITIIISQTWVGENSDSYKVQTVFYLTQYFFKRKNTVNKKHHFTHPFNVSG